MRSLLSESFSLLQDKKSSEYTKKSFDYYGTLVSLKMNALNFNDVKYQSGQFFFDRRKVERLFPKLKNQKNPAENVSNDFQFHSFSKFRFQVS